MRPRIIRRILLHTFVLLMILCGLGGGLMLVFFVVAETPQEAALQGKSMPANWSAGVPWRGGGYTEWYTISDAPFLFALTLAMVISFLTFMVVGHWMQAKQRRANAAVQSNVEET